MTRFFSLHCLLLPLLASLGLAGCAGAPVQEMSNARQAIKAARDANSQLTSPALQEAEALLTRAEGSLHRRDFREARRDAIAAHGKAAEAMSTGRKRDGMR